MAAAACDDVADVAVLLDGVGDALVDMGGAVGGGEGGVEVDAGGGAVGGLQLHGRCPAQTPPFCPGLGLDEKVAEVVDCKQTTWELGTA